MGQTFRGMPRRTCDKRGICVMCRGCDRERRVASRRWGHTRFVDGERTLAGKRSFHPPSGNSIFAYDTWVSRRRGRSKWAAQRAVTRVRRCVIVLLRRGSLWPAFNLLPRTSFFFFFFFFFVPKLQHFLSFKYAHPNNKFVQLLLNHLYPAISKGKRRIIVYGFGHSLWSAIGCQRKWLTSFYARRELCNIFSVLNILRYNPSKTDNKFITYQ